MELKMWTHDFNKSSWEYCSSVWYYYNNISVRKKNMIVFSLVKQKKYFSSPQFSLFYILCLVYFDNIYY